MGNPSQLHDLWLVGSNIVFFLASAMARYYRQPIVMWTALIVGTCSTIYHGSACIWPLGSEIRNILNFLDWIGCAIAIIAAGYYIGWRLMGLLPKAMNVATIIFTLAWFKYSISGDFERYESMHTAFHFFGSLPMFFLSYQGYVFRRIQEKWEPDDEDMSFWTSVHAVQTRTVRDIMHLAILGVYLRRKLRRVLKSWKRKLAKI